MESEQKKEQGATAEAIFSETEYETAWENAGPLARRRFAKKTTKVKYRAARWVEDKNAPGGGYVAKTRLPPADVAVYTVRWVSYFKNKQKENK